MLSQERQRRIMEILEKDNTVKIIDIVKLFRVSHETARRDLETLQDQGMAKRVYGGAIYLPPAGGSAPENHGPRPVRRERRAIARAAAELVHEGDTVLLGMGTTVQEVAKCLRTVPNLTVVTNSIFVLNELVDSDVNLYMLGGHVSSSEHHLEGQLVLDGLQSFNLDVAILGCAGATLECGVSDYSYEVAQMDRAMLRRARRGVLVAQSDKFGKDCFSVACPLEQFHTVVTDNALSDDYRRGLAERGIGLILANVAPGT